LFHAACANRSVASTDATLVEDVAIAIARAWLNALTPTHTAFVKHIAVAVALAGGNANAPTHATLVHLRAGAIFFCGFWGKVAGIRVRTSEDLVHVAHTVSIHVCLTWATADTQGIKLVAVAIAVVFWDVKASTFVNRAWSKAHVALVFKSSAFFFRIANAVVVQIRRAIATAYANGVQLIPIAVTVSLRDVGTSTFVNVAWTIAHAACINHTNALIDVVANAIDIGVFKAGSTANSNGIKYVFVAVAITFWDVGASAFVNGSLAIANSASVDVTHTIVLVVANPISILVGFTIATADSDGVLLAA
jgi:hypothetical protein